jgi:hypothetical protein
MTTRRAACSCGQLRLTIEGEPSRIWTCHCLECQRRTGAVIGNLARFHREQIIFDEYITDAELAADLLHVHGPPLTSMRIGGPQKRKARAGCSFRLRPRASTSDHCSPPGARVRPFFGG